MRHCLPRTCGDPLRGQGVRAATGWGPARVPQGWVPAGLERDISSDLSTLLPKFAKADDTRH